MRARRRIQSILLSNEGWTVEKIANHLGADKRNIWRWFKNYQEKGLDGLKGKYFSRKL
ncbi:MAG: helix-turn-helix domain-containing protein [Planctomycetes bacterium]|nr:helix-turn-helix domain-containing protein [Planctomycetota bacterium]